MLFRLSRVAAVTFSPLTWEHFRTPHNRGLLEDYSGEGWAGSSVRGRYMRIRTKLFRGRVEAASFQTYGCVPSIACGSYLTSWALGKTVEQALGMTSCQLSEGLGGLPSERFFCAEMAVHALRQALQPAEAVR